MTNTTDLQAGLTGNITAKVGDADLAIALGSGSVAVLGTPRLVALCEQATVIALQEVLEPTETTVGTHIDIKHLVATPINGEVTASARLAQVDNRALCFDVEAHDRHGTLIGSGIIKRYVVNTEKFISKLPEA